MRFERLDLNLLVALDALLEEQSVSAAAERLCLSQSATSSALGRLREYFEDDLLVVKGRKMVVTARGEELIEPVRAVLQQIRSTISVAPEFDPSTSDRTISIMASDYVMQVILAHLLRVLEQDAPNMRFELLALNDNIVEVFERGLTDLLITLDHSTADRHPKHTLFYEDFVVLGWEGNPHLRDVLDLETYLSLGHIVTKFGRTRMPSFEDWYLKRSEHERKVQVSVAGFAAVPPLLVGTNRLATVHRQLAEIMSKSYPLKIMRPPVDIPRVSLAVQWHESASSDRAINWVVEKMMQVAEQVTGAIDPVETHDIDVLKRFSRESRKQAD